MFKTAEKDDAPVKAAGDKREGRMSGHSPKQAMFKSAKDRRFPGRGIHCGADGPADEGLLATQHLIYDDESALLESAKRARSELEQLFEADADRADAADGRPAAAD